VFSRQSVFLYLFFCKYLHNSPLFRHFSSRSFKGLYSRPRSTAYRRTLEGDGCSASPVEAGHCSAFGSYRFFLTFVTAFSASFHDCHSSSFRCIKSISLFCISLSLRRPSNKFFKMSAKTERFQLGEIF
jgi:hypothetical protein